LARFLAQFNNLLILLLLAAAGVAALLGHWLDAQVILFVVLVNAILGFVQEGRAEKALDAIRELLSPQSTVVRDSRRISIPAEQLVPGDLCLVEAGDRVPADLRLVRANALQIDEAMLTGEAVPAEKSVEPAPVDAPLGDRAGMAFSGTLVTAGQGAGIVVATGTGTEIGKISTMLGEVPELTTPLLRQMAVFARRLTVVVLGVAVATFLFGVLMRGLNPADMFVAVVSLSVAAIPEGLPTILTVTLAIGVRRMARRNAVVRRLPAVEALGSVSVICSDKTGTLTRNEMTVRAVATADRLYEVTGVGYEPRGAFRADGADVMPDGEPVLREFLRAAVLCNDAHLSQAGSSGGWVVAGDPMEGALVAAAVKAGYDQRLEAERFPRTDVIPFDAQHRFMATLHHDHEGHAFLYVKGAPERLLAMCDRQQTAGGLAPLDPAFWHHRVDELAAQGQRVLAVATKAIGPDQRTLTFADVEDGLELLGLLGLIDPPREEAVAAVAECHRAGIRVKMITGDHAMTARAVAAQVGLENTAEVLTGADLARLDPGELPARALVVDVFARTSPADKIALVEALQARAAVVAMTGDGVNDAPALKRADVGVAMGRKGTEAAKEAAEIVLLDDNFASIAAAVREGRTVYDNLKKAITFLLPINGGEASAIIVAILAGSALPITPLQILWVNMVSSVTLAMVLAFEPTERDAMRRPPRRSDEPLISGFLVWRVALVSALFLAGIFGMFAWSLNVGLSIEEARTVAVNTLVVMEIFYLFSVRYLRVTSLTYEGVLGTPPVLIGLGAVVVLQLAFTYAPFMQALFDTRPLGLAHGLLIVGVGAALFGLLEIEKHARRMLLSRAP
jgi:magnesium-transporting ATPase (P-type)